MEEWDMMRSKIVRTLVLGMCITVFSTGIAYAETGRGVSAAPGGEKEILIDLGEGAPDRPVSSPAPDETVSVNPEILAKQIELDRYLFGQGAQELADRGFTVTHTVPLDNYVEIGINPYNEKNAEFLYETLGRDKIKIVEGTQAIAMDLAVQTGAVAEIAGANDAAEKNSGISFPIFSAIGIAVLVSIGVLRRKVR
jgi:hypothetical protein